MPASSMSLRTIRKLRLHQFQVIESILQSGSFALAAQHLGMTQSAVTKAVQEMEAFFDARLFVRSHRGVRPTELGLRLESHIRVILAETRHMADSLNALRLGEGGHLNVGVLTTATSGAFTEAVRLLHQRHPRIQVTVLVGDRSQLHGYLIDSRVDLVFGSMPPPSAPHLDRLQAHALYEDSLVVMAGQHHPLARRRRVRLEDLAAWPWILPPEESVVRQRIDRLFADAGLALPQDCIESLAPLLNIGLMGDHKTLTFMSSGLARMLQASAALTPLKIDLPVSFATVGYVVRAEREPSFACARLIECLREKADRPPGAQAPA